MQVLKDNGKLVSYQRLDRHCPRCHKHRCHRAVREQGKPHIHLTCAECGHDWTGRFRNDEWDDWRELTAWEKEQVASTKENGVIQ